MQSRRPISGDKFSNDFNHTLEPSLGAQGEPWARPGHSCPSQARKDAGHVPGDDGLAFGLLRQVPVPVAQAPACGSGWACVSAGAAAGCRGAVRLDGIIYRTVGCPRFHAHKPSISMDGSQLLGESVTNILGNAGGGERPRVRLVRSTCRAGHEAWRLILTELKKDFERAAAQF